MMLLWHGLESAQRTLMREDRSACGMHTLRLMIMKLL